MDHVPDAPPEVVLAVDQGTTNSKAVLVDRTGVVVSVGSAPVGVLSPAAGWVEQDAERIWTSTLTAIASCLGDAPARVVGLGLSTQRESVLAWHAVSGAPLGPVIGWQDRRTAAWCADTFDAAADAEVRSRTGLGIDAMYSAPKIRWLLDHLPSGTDRAHVRVGTVDAWLLWRLTGGAVHATDAGNASRTLLFDVTSLDWADELLELFDVPRAVLPEVRRSDAAFGTTSGVPGLPDGLPVLAVLADSHAALYGQGCTTAGSAKATYGTGSSVMAPVGEFLPGGSGVPTTLAWLRDAPAYAREGNILSSGDALAWVADLLTAGRVPQLMNLAESVDDSGGVALVPAFSGLGAPHWDRGAVATLSGMTRSSTPAQVARAAVEAVCHQVCDVVGAITADGITLTALRADGGATISDLLMQTQADLLDLRVEVADVAEASALGAAALAWQGIDPGLDWSLARGRERVFEPRIDAGDRDRRRDAWRAAVARARYRPPEEG